MKEERGQLAGRSPYKDLLNDKNVRRWFLNAQRSSPSYAYELLRRLGYIRKRFGVTPQDLAKMRPKQATDFILDMVTDLEEEKLAGSYVVNYVKAAKNWLEFNDKKITRKIKVKGSDVFEKYAKEKPPTPDELRKILHMADFRTRVAISLIAFSGVRLEVLGHYLGEDGLKIKDLPEMTIKDATVTFDPIPTLIAVRKEISKIRRPYATFYPDEGCEYLKEYLEWRMQQGEQLTGESPIITPHHKFQRHLVGRHVRTTNISDLIHKTFLTAGFKMRPYVLRRYFDLRLSAAEADGLIIRDWRTFWMGHKGDIEFVYTFAKGLPDDILQKMRNGYAKAADQYLITTGKKEATTETRVLDTMNRRILAYVGYTEEEIDRLDLAKLSEEEMQDLVRRKSAQALFGIPNGGQKVVPLGEVKKWILDGWVFVQALPESEAVIRLPSFP